MMIRQQHLEQAWGQQQQNPQQQQHMHANAMEQAWSGGNMQVNFTVISIQYTVLVAVVVT
jgi:hypothetical protein